MKISSDPTCVEDLHQTVIDATFPAFLIGLSSCVSLIGKAVVGFWLAYSMRDSLIANLLAFGWQDCVLFSFGLATIFWALRSRAGAAKSYPVLLLFSLLLMLCNLAFLAFLALTFRGPFMIPLGGLGVANIVLVALIVRGWSAWRQLR